MSRTFIIKHDDGTNTALFSSNTHERMTAVERAMHEGNVVDDDGNPVTQFHFDLPDYLKGITTERMQSEVLSGLMFSVDAFINGALNRMLNAYYKHAKTETAVMTFDTYSQFLRHIESIESTEQSLYEAGCDVQPEVARLHVLSALRDELHYVVASKLRDPTTYVKSELGDTLSAPRMRGISGAEEANMLELAKFEHTDPAMVTAIHEAYLQGMRDENANQFKMDKLKAASIVALWNCVNIGETIIDDESNAFELLDPKTQASLLNRIVSIINQVKARMWRDNRLTIMEKAKMRVESVALIQTVKDALEHSVFSDLDN